MTDDTPTPELPDYLPGVAPAEVARTADPGGADLETPALLAAEERFLRAWRDRAGDGPTPARRTGIGLSGGGVRSAAFALGALQTLAGRDLLGRFDYLSSVSGGGFASGSLAWLLGPATAEASAEATGEAPGPRFGTGPDDFPFGAEPRGEAPTATGAESDAGGGPGGPDSPPGSAALLNFLRQHGAYLVPGHGITPVSSVAVVLRGILLNLLVWLPILVALMLAPIALSGLVGDPVTKGAGSPVAFDALGGIAIGLALAFALGCLVYSFSTHPRWNARERRYLLHRRHETLTPWLLGPLAGAATLASLPHAANASFARLGEFGGAIFVAAGLGVGLWSFLGPEGGRAAAFVRKRALPLGALSALYGVLLFAYQSALWLYLDAGAPTLAGAALLLAVAIASGRFVNLNYVSVQRFYRDRLMEAFMPDLDRALDGQGGPAPAADGQRLSDCLDRARPRRPYPLFNAHLPLASAESRRRRLRGGDNFVLSPLYCGSTATGWRRTGRFMDDGMTLPTAVAVSGSVNHRQSGLGGVGLALNPLVSLLKVLLNLRMGYWVPHPRADDQSRRPHHFRPGLGEALALGRGEDDAFLLLEDGGYFDNLGLYELLRRRLAVILVCDAGADADARLSDLHRALRLAELDFGARVAFDEPEDYLAVVPDAPAAFPDGARLAERAHLVGRVDYADGSTGTLVYLKSVLVPGMAFAEVGFGSRLAGFPQETTADQFFDEEQFDAHRRLGCELARRMIDGVDLGRRLREAAGTSATG